MTNLIGRAGLLGAGPFFAGGLALMQPQMTAAADGAGFLGSIALEPAAWINGHILMLVAAGLYALAGSAVTRTLEGQGRPLAGQLIGLPLIAGAVLLGGNFALDFVYAALVNGMDLETANAVRTTLISDPILPTIFSAAGPAIWLLGMASLALYALITGAVSRLTGVLILAGWGIVMGLHGAFPYAEALGHFTVGAGFGLVAFARSDA